MAKKAWFELMIEDFMTDLENVGPCPSGDDLLAYVQARLDGRALDAKLQAIARHATRCPACHRETEEVIEALSIEKAPVLPRPIKPLTEDFLSRLIGFESRSASSRGSWTNKVADRFESLVGRWRLGVDKVGRSLRQMGEKLVLSVPPLVPAPAMVAAGVRGSAQVYRYEIPELSATITLTPERGERGWLITGELEPDSAERSGLEGVTLRLLRAAGPDESVEVSAQTDDLGCFLFEDLEAGRYEIEIPIGTVGSIILAEINVG